MIICYFIFFFLLCIYVNYELNLAHPAVVSLSFMAQKCKQIVDFSPQKCLGDFNLISPLS